MGERLREYRTKLNYTQEQAAEILEMSLTYYGKIERGINGLSLEKMKIAYQKMNVDPVYLLTGEKQPEITFDGLLKTCPRDKRYELEQLIRYALELVK
jgi:transcriptional regulator with XRE-family HTH domain